MSSLLSSLIALPQPGAQVGDPAACVSGHRLSATWEAMGVDPQAVNPPGTATHVPLARAGDDLLSPSPPAGVGEGPLAGHLQNQDHPLELRPMDSWEEGELPTHLEELLEEGEVSK